MNYRKFLTASAAALVPVGTCVMRRIGILLKMNRLAKGKVNGT